ncbi:YidC/Oxa1 family membrane protein insertase [Bacilli bacterium PM5-3]|nr:YidC/Oxa1 family membrane protein insertase [Bacilli bacterium PM5-3]MDH6604179.1 YidC/Oxa1 family membrane protein insertase [Bacilli bacterium PM5-9]
MKYIKNILIVFLVVMMLTSCTGNMNFEIPVDATIDGGFQYGIFQGFIVFPIGVLINKLTIILGSSAVAMIVTTILVRSVTLPITLKGQLATRGMQELQPKIQDLEEKYRGRTDEASKQRKAMEMQKIYQSMDVNPMSGMLYPFLSMPLFMGVWRATSMSVVIKEADPFLGLFNLGISPGEAFGQGNYYYVILMILVGITQFIQFRLTNHLTNKRNADNKSYRVNPQAEQMSKQMNIMMYGFTVMMLFMSYTLISAMSVYLTVSALVSIAQAFYTDRVMRKAG